MAGKPKVVGGVDTHADTLHVAVLTLLGRKLADKEFHTDARGYWDAIRFMTGHGRVQSVGVEGTSSYGAGLTKALITAGLEVIEVNRPDRAARRRRGKSDPLDAELAARAVLSGNATSAPKDPTIEAIRASDTQILTIGQYLRPSPEHLPVRRYYTPQEFEELRAFALGLGYSHVESGPLVRSSYHAESHVPSIAAK